jgi:hypothetical protein
MRERVKFVKQPLKDLKFLSYGIHQLEIAGPLVFYLSKKIISSTCKPLPFDSKASY